MLKTFFFLCQFDYSPRVSILSFMKMSIQEIRRYARVTVDSKIIACVVKKGRGAKKEFTATGKNISADGLQLISNEQLDPATKLALKVTLPGKKKSIFTINGNVVWCVPAYGIDQKPVLYNTGVKFTNSTKEHLKMLITYVCGDKAKDLLKELS